MTHAFVGAATQRSRPHGRGNEPQSTMARIPDNSKDAHTHTRIPIVMFAHAQACANAHARSPARPPARMHAFAHSSAHSCMHALTQGRLNAPMHLLMHTHAHQHENTLTLTTNLWAECIRRATERILFFPSVAALNRRASKRRRGKRRGAEARTSVGVNVGHRRAPQIPRHRRRLPTA